jgi:flagellar capping protein FliD
MFFTEGLCIRKGLLSFVRKYNNLVISITPSTRKLPGRNKITQIKDEKDLLKKKKLKDNEKESVFWWLEW